ncbi:MAG: hypothetical protein J07HQX50_01720 [Haloquadratum sp. J07HQX50]|nr:MAG: hypothetical protein J07HQX50_01720 [Haloquadratum sp. J07HQX50]
MHDMRYPYNHPDGYEEQLNDQVIAHLHYSLQQGPTLLNLILADLPVEVTDKAEIVAHQADPLPITADTDVNREIDWVVRDEETIIGFESKYGAQLRSTQLEDELAKLNVNADSRDVHLVAITHHAGRPSVMTQFDSEPISWLNWYTVSQTLTQLDAAEIPSSQQVPVQMLQDLFEIEDMTPFTGFNHQDKQQYRYFIRDLRPEVNRIELENRGNLHTWAEESPTPSGGSRIVPEYIAIPFCHKDRPDHDSGNRPKSKRASVPLVVIDTEAHTVHAGVVFGVQKVPSHRELLLDRGDEIARELHDADYELWIGRNSINNRNVPIEKTSELDTMRTWLSDTDKKVLASPSEDNNYRNVWFLRKCSGEDVEALFESVVKTLADQKRRFIEADKYIAIDTLADPDTV